MAIPRAAFNKVPDVKPVGTDAVWAFLHNNTEYAFTTEEVVDGVEQSRSDVQSALQWLYQQDAVQFNGQFWTTNE